VSWVIEQHSQLFDENTQSWNRNAVMAWIRTQGADYLLSASEVEKLLHYGTHLCRLYDVKLTSRSA
jgi:lipopolysaccharide export system protein LptC